jgi:hypothetical protein
MVLRFPSSSTTTTTTTRSQNVYIITGNIKGKSTTTTISASVVYQAQNLRENKTRRGKCFLYFLRLLMLLLEASWSNIPIRLCVDWKRQRLQLLFSVFFSSTFMRVNENAVAVVPHTHIKGNLCKMRINMYIYLYTRWWEVGKKEGKKERYMALNAHTLTHFVECGRRKCDKRQ